MLIFVIMRRVAQPRYQARSQAWLNVDDTVDKDVPLSFCLAIEVSRQPDHR